MVCVLVLIFGTSTVSPIFAAAPPEGCGPGGCDEGSYFDECGRYPATANVSLAMCGCGWLDPLCGIGTCDETGAYREGENCPGMTHEPSSPIALAMCGEMAIDPLSCLLRCTSGTRILTAGEADNYSMGNREPAEPSPALTDYIMNIYGKPPRAFDVEEKDLFFGHTFVGLQPRGRGHLCGAQLEVQLNTLGDNDSLSLRFVGSDGPLRGSPTWGDSLANLGVPYNTDTRLIIDITSLPNGREILSWMERGFLDVLVQEDTAVDHLQLELRECCPCGHRVITAGVKDDFSGAIEPASPSAGVAAFVAANYPNPTLRDFDDEGINRWFGHTFSGLQPPGGRKICGARLRTRLMYSDLTDTMAVGFIDATGVMSPVRWSIALPDLGFPAPITIGELIIDLGKKEGGPELLQRIEDGTLDFLVQDDSALDFAELQLDHCCEGDAPIEVPDPAE